MLFCGKALAVMDTKRRNCGVSKNELRGLAGLQDQEEAGGAGTGGLMGDGVRLVLLLSKAGG